jgi:hypothetical protein
MTGKHRLTVSLTAAALSVAGLASPCRAQIVSMPFDQDYTVDVLGSVPGVPTNYGGLTFLAGDPNTILIGGAANSASGALYAIGVERDEENHVVGFVGTAERYAAAEYNDGGVTYGPDDVLFLARWPVNELGQLEPGSTAADKIIAMGQFGVPSSLSALAFVPEGFPGAGSLKLVTYGGGSWFDATAVPDGSGTYDLANVTFELTIQGGPEGFVYVPPGSPQFDDFTSILVAEYAAGRIATYEVDENGDPIVLTRRDFLTGLSGAEGAVVDPITGDFLFSTFGGGSQVVAVRGFGSPNLCSDDPDCEQFEDACHSASCDLETGTCRIVERENGSPCTSGASCLSPGICDDGECLDEAPCPTGPGCEDTCDEESGECRTCGAPFSNDRCIVIAVVVLQGALDLRECERCTCDVDSSGTVAATGALMVLRRCAGLPSDLDCIDIGSSTTTIGQ